MDRTTGEGEEVVKTAIAKTRNARNAKLGEKFGIYCPDILATKAHEIKASKTLA